MADINSLIASFFVNDGDPVEAANNPNDPDVAVTSASRPFTDAGVKATALIDGVNYFGAVRQEIAALLAGGTDRFFYTASWIMQTSATPDFVQIGEGSVTSAWKENARNWVWTEQPFQLEDTTAGPFHPFRDDIRSMVQAGVDFRALVWASPFLVNFQAAARAGGTYTMQYWGVNVTSLQSILDLRTLPGLESKIVINALAHTMAAMHLKMVVCGDSSGFRAYVGGIDFTTFRNAKPTHEVTSVPNRRNDWHDVMVKIEGTTANSVYRRFGELWNEQVQRAPRAFKAFGGEVRTHDDSTPLVDDRQTPPVTGGTQHTQVLQTLPTMKFGFFGSDRAPINCLKRLVTSFKQDKLSFAPDGRFEFRAAQRKAVLSALQYIYIEDQVMENIELARWMNLRMHEVPELKVIMFFGGDPADPPPFEMPDMMDVLLDSLSAPEERVVFVKAPHIVHSKITIIDDAWAVIGSSNSWRRSFYLDGEINIAVLDEADPSFAKLLRKDLWGEHCGKTPGPDCDPLLPLNDALGIWRASWGNPPFPLSPSMAVKTIPFVYTFPPVANEAWLAPRPPSPTQDEMDQKDGDSRLEY